MTRARLKGYLAAVAPPVLFSVLVALVWHGSVTLLGIKPYLLPGPLAVAHAVSTHLETLLGAAALTALAALSGFVLSFAIGFLVAVLFSQSRLAERSLYPYAIFLQTVPIVAIAPLIVLWIGHGLAGVVAVSFIISLFPVIANTTAGLTSVDEELLDLFSLNQASRWQVLTKLRVPHAVPAMLTGARISCGLSVIGAIVGEFFASYAGEDAGLGLLVASWIKQYHTDRAFAAVALASVLGLLMFSAVNVAASLLLRRWHASEQVR